MAKAKKQWVHGPKKIQYTVDHAVGIGDQVLLDRVLAAVWSRVPEDQRAGLEEEVERLAPRLVGSPRWSARSTR